jgi:hypothetical protein
MLRELGNELRFPLTKCLGQGIWALRAQVGTVNYRILYFFCGKNMACLSNGLTKEDEIPTAEFNYALTAQKLVSSDLDRYTAEWEY